MSSEDELDPETQAIFEAFARFRAAVEKRIFDNIVDSQPAEPEFFSPDGSPMPNYCHPAYDYARTEIEHWLRGDLYQSATVLQLPVPTSLRVSFDPSPEVTAPIWRCHQLRRVQCAGPAPYVGDPFVYRWWVAVDENERMVSADAEIVYLPQRLVPASSPVAACPSPAPTGTQP